MRQETDSKEPSLLFDDQERFPEGCCGPDSTGFVSMATVHGVLAVFMASGWWVETVAANPNELTVFMNYYNILSHCII